MNWTILSKKKITLQNVNFFLHFTTTGLLHYFLDKTENFAKLGKPPHKDTISSYNRRLVVLWLNKETNLANGHADWQGSRSPI